ncbi:hypothetical protein Ciccas_006725 [Cichlidogyrus casuarinus]|uniref:Ras-GEF domain-containing protein n=1 Tax=Cichlidogyrus casuarinus TaxID=1844966 RepID=A0ABD2Q7D4_9PLAT
MNQVRQYMSPPYFAEYRDDLKNAPFPKLPYLGLIIQQLIHFNEGNKLCRRIMDIDFVDVWCLQKQFSIISNLLNPAS